MDWKKAGAGILHGTRDKQNGWKHFTKAEEWDAFRKAHPGPQKGSKEAEDERPLPDFDFSKHELLIVWAGTMTRELDIVSVRPGVVEMHERELFKEGEHVAHSKGSATYEILALPRTGKPVTVKWSSDPPPWKLVSHGLLSDIEEMKSGWAHLRDASAYEEFRRKHVRVTSRSKREHKTEPLPDFDFAKGELVIAWGGTMYRFAEILCVQDGVVFAQETRPSFNENEVARMLHTGAYSMISVPRGGKPLEVRWAR